MKGFKDFIMRGNLVELAVAFIIATSFAAVIKTFTDVVMGLIGKIWEQPDFSAWKPGGVPFGSFVTALIAFLVLAAIVYFLVVTPYERVKARYARVEEDAAPDEEVILLREIRDALTRRV